MGESWNRYFNTKSYVNIKIIAIMGKVLILKGADFSNVSMETTSFDGKVFLSRDNYLFSKKGYFKTDTLVWSPSVVDECLFYPISAGDMVCVPAENITTSQVVALCTIVDDTPIILSTNQIKYVNLGKYGKMFIAAPSDCYVVILSVFNNTPVVFNGTYLTGKGNRDTITADNWELYTKKYLRSDGTWGNYSLSYLYPVCKEDTINIKANANNYTKVCFVDYRVNSDVNKEIIDMPPVIAFDGVIAKRIEAGEEAVISAPENCYMVIFAEGGNRFPQSIVISNS